jgi:hypothetical protein
MPRSLHSSTHSCIEPGTHDNSDTVRHVSGSGGPLYPTPTPAGSGDPFCSALAPAGSGSGDPPFVLHLRRPGRGTPYDFLHALRPGRGTPLLFYAYMRSSWACHTTTDLSTRARLNSCIHSVLPYPHASCLQASNMASGEAENKTYSNELSVASLLKAGRDVPLPRACSLDRGSEAQAQWCGYAWRRRCQCVSYLEYGAIYRVPRPLLPWRSLGHLERELWPLDDATWGMWHASGGNC